ncbi:hypothetical protein ONZ45_g18177 [Pleurotus djamor]|nr:hypothetical protein ONZ45_g18177 [Pleurotus djamor]
MVFEIIMLVLTVIKGMKDRSIGMVSTYTHPFDINQVERSLQFIQIPGIGVLYYVVLASISFANVLVLLFATLRFATLLATPQHVFHSILSARILLRLREDAHQRERVGTLSAGPATTGSSIFVTETMKVVPDVETTLDGRRREKDVGVVWRCKF